MWSLTDRIPPGEIAKVFQRYADCRVSGELTVTENTPILLDNGDPVPVADNLIVCRAGDRKALALQGRWFFHQICACRCHMLGKLLYGIERDVWGHNGDVMTHLFTRFFKADSKGFGWATLVFSRRSKHWRQKEDPAVQHTLRKADTNLTHWTRPSDRETPYFLTEFFRFPLFRFIWKTDTTLYSHSRIPLDSLAFACHKYGLRHEVFLAAPTHYYEHRFTVARPWDYSRFRQGFIPVLDNEPGQPLTAGGILRTLLVCLRRVSPNGLCVDDCALEFDPRSLEMISIRASHQPVATYITNTSAFDQYEVSQAVRHYY